MERIKIAILDSATLGNDIDLSVFDRLGDTEIYSLTARELIAERISDADVCVINKVRLDECVLKDAKKLKLICVAATGYDNIDTIYCGIFNGQSYPIICEHQIHYSLANHTQFH